MWAACGDHLAYCRYAKSTKANLSTLATTGTGHLAVGSETGEIRLYCEVGQRRKNLLPGLGAPIRAMDVTEDGKWVLATCDTFLLLVPATVEKANGKIFSQFEVSNARERGKPVKLLLSPEDLAKYGITKVRLTSARFNTGVDIQESWIVSSTGPYVITWNLGKFKRGGGLTYEIKKASSSIVAEQFRFGHDEVVIATDRNVFKARRR